MMRNGCFYSILAVFMALPACAYRFGQGTRSLPGGYHQMSVPIFKNRSPEPGIEVAFTQALQQEFLRSKVARVVDDPLAEVRVEGEIVSVEYLPEAQRAAGDSNAGYLPQSTVIASKYRVLTVVDVRLIRRSDGESLWTGRFNGEATYSAPFVTLPHVNSVNPLYNLSARRQNFETLAASMMTEVHGRMTENF